MNQELFSKFALLARGTLLEEDRDSNFPSENTVPGSYKSLCEELVNIWDEVIQMPLSYGQRRKVLCDKVERIVSSARARLNNC